LSLKSSTRFSVILSPSENLIKIGICTAQVYSVTDEPTAMHLHALFALRERQLERIEALFSTLVYAFWTHVERHWQRICDEIERGTIRGQSLTVGAR